LSNDLYGVMDFNSILFYCKTCPAALWATAVKLSDGHQVETDSFVWNGFAAYWTER